MQVQKQIDELLALRASEWVELLPTASATQLRSLEAWLSESRLHVQEFLEVAEVEFRLRSIDAQRRHDIDALLQRIAPNVAAMPKRAAAGPFVAVAGSLRWKVAGLAAALAGLALVAWVAFGRWPGADRYTTAIGEQRIVELADRSVVTLNADSQISVRLADAERQIELLKGEAIFTVAPDPYRPFRVHTRAGTVQAVGTQFNVHTRINGNTRVSVLEGQVRLAAQAGAGADSQSEQLLLSAGQEAEIGLDGAIQPHHDAVVANAVAWRERRLVFENARLEEIVTEFNRHNRGLRLKLDGVEGDVRRYDGVFEATDPQALAQLLSRETDLVVERHDKEIVIRKR